MDIKEEDYQKAVAVVRKSLSGSVSNIQRKLNWGYCRAASAVDRMQSEFIVSPMSASGRRDVYP
ncbi:DNA translocase FtsK, partial [Acinetobacter guillouiae]|uniref:DNA translocase FtsK n=2 Tax=Acinetobacter TaxID=469 RepID=UPI003AF60F62